MWGGGGGDRERVARAVACGGVAGSVPFLLVLWGFGFRPFRTAVHQGVFSNFYDVQAHALIGGHLWVPDGSLSIEAFIHAGREYLYFPPFPAILRMPLLAFTERFDGRLTALSMLVAWIVIVVVTGLLLWRVRGMVRPGVPVGRIELWSYGALVAVVGGGSVLVFDASLPWVYHETYFWSTALTLGALHAAIGVLELLTPRRIAVAFAWTTATILTRTTTGWACSFTLVAIAAFIVMRRPAEQRRRALAVGAAGAGALLIGAAVNFAKFRHPYLFPLETQRWTELNEHRRQALAANGGHLTGGQFFPTTFTTYLRPDGIRFTPVFPFITLPPRAPRVIGGAFFDQTYRTGSITAFMPLLCCLGVVGAISTFRRRAVAGLVLLRIPVLGAAVITLGVLFYGYMAHRYTSEFLPVLVLTSVIGVVALGTRAGRWSRSGRAGRLAVCGALATFGVVANTAIGLSSARTTYGGESLRSLVDIQQRIGDLLGRQRSDDVVLGDFPSLEAPADQIHIVGECAAIYMATGDRYEPWVTVEVATVSAHVDVIGTGMEGSTRLLAFAGRQTRYLVLERLGSRLFRFAVETVGDEPVNGIWFPLEIGDSLDVEVVADLDDAAYDVQSPLRFRAYLPIADAEARDAKSRPSVMQIVVDAAEARGGMGAEITVQRAAPSMLCRELAL